MGVSHTPIFNTVFFAGESKLKEFFRHFFGSEPQHYLPNFQMAHNNPQQEPFLAPCGLPYIQQTKPQSENIHSGFEKVTFKGDMLPKGILFGKTSFMK